MTVGRRWRWPRTGTLAVLAGLLIASAALRLLSGADAFVARAQDQADPIEMAATGAENVGDIAPEDMPNTLLEALRAQKARLDARERKIQLREKALEVTESEISEKMAALVDAEDRLRQTIALARGAAEADIAGLTEVYSKMKPKNAALLFTEMAPDFAAGFLARMRPDVVAGIMAGLPPDRAYAVSAILAARNSEVPKEEGEGAAQSGASE